MIIFAYEIFDLLRHLNNAALGPMYAIARAINEITTVLINCDRSNLDLELAKDMQTNNKDIQAKNLTCTVRRIKMTPRPSVTLQRYQKPMLEGCKGR
jgi:hypothetical protein